MSLRKLYPCTCHGCGKAFMARRPTTKFHSLKCSQKHSCAGANYWRKRAEAQQTQPASV